MLRTGFLPGSSTVTFIAVPRITHPVLGLPTPIISQENVSRTCIQAFLMESLPQMRYSLPINGVGLWQVDKPCEYRCSVCFTVMQSAFRMLTHTY